MSNSGGQRAQAGDGGGSAVLTSCKPDQTTAAPAHSARNRRRRGGRGSGCRRADRGGGGPGGGRQGLLVGHRDGAAGHFAHGPVIRVKCFHHLWSSAAREGQGSAWSPTDRYKPCWGRGGATPRFWTPTTPPTNCWPEVPWGGGGGGGGHWRGGSGRANGGGGIGGAGGVVGVLGAAESPPPGYWGYHALHSGCQNARIRLFAGVGYPVPTTWTVLVCVHELHYPPPPAPPFARTMKRVHSWTETIPTVVLTRSLSVRATRGPRQRAHHHRTIHVPSSESAAGGRLRHLISARGGGGTKWQDRNRPQHTTPPAQLTEQTSSSRTLGKWNHRIAMAPFVAETETERPFWLRGGLRRALCECRSAPRIFPRKVRSIQMLRKQHLPLV